MYAEATGLMASSDYNGHAYVMSNFQHPGDGKFDGTGGYKGSDAAAIGAAINQSDAGSLPRPFHCNAGTGRGGPPADLSACRAFHAFGHVEFPLIR